MRFLKKVLGFIDHPTQSRTAAILVLFILFAAIPLTVIISQQQQQIRQRAEGLEEDCLNKRNEASFACGKEFDDCVARCNTGDIDEFSFCQESCAKADETGCSKNVNDKFNKCLAEASVPSIPTSTPTPTLPPTPNASICRSIGDPCITENGQSGKCSQEGKCLTTTSTADPSCQNKSNGSLCFKNSVAGVCQQEQCVLLGSSPTPTPTLTPTPTINPVNSCIQSCESNFPNRDTASVNCINGCILRPQSIPTPTPTPFVLAPTNTPFPTTTLIILPTLAPTSIPINTIVQNSPTAAPFCALKNKGDANCDNIINLLDFELWRTEFLGMLKGISIINKPSDFNNDRLITIVDFNIWKTGFADQSLPH